MPPKQPAFALPKQLLFFIVLFYSFVFSCQQNCNHQDQSALLAFSSNISTSPPIPLNWSSSINCCLWWEGIECDVNGRVTELLLPSRGLNGVISSSISSLKSLRIIDLSLNSFIGSIPQEIGKLSYLENLHLYGNNLSGPIPSSLMNCTNLVEILLRDNHLNGDIISNLDFSRLVQLQKLNLRNNSLKGTLPESIYSCKSLVAIGVAQNAITGQISPKIVELKSLSFLSLSENSFTDITATLRILAKCKNLTVLLSLNFYGESLPIHRSFIGLEEFPKLQFFALESCEFAAGPIPNWLSTLKSLHLLSLQGNRMTGSVPTWFGTLPNLYRLELNNNSLSGELPLKLFQFPALMSRNIQAHLNFFPFEIPVSESIWNQDNYIRRNNNFYAGLDLSYNAFSGDIPKEIGNLQNLQELNLNNNHFTGHIPCSISNLKNLVKLNLSVNRLTGEIPTSLGSLSFLSHFNVSYNDLQGPIPTGVQFSTFDESSFKGNTGLCGELVNRSCLNSTTSMGRNGSRDHNMQGFLNGLFVGFASGFSSILIVVASYVWLNDIKRCRPASSRRG